MNKVILIGRLTKDPELRTIATGNATTSFTIAVNRNFTNQMVKEKQILLTALLGENRLRTLLSIVPKVLKLLLRDVFKLEVMMPKMEQKDMLLKLLLIM